MSVIEKYEMGVVSLINHINQQSQQYSIKKLMDNIESH